MADRIEAAYARNRRRRRKGRVVYLLLVIAAALAIWYFIPQDVIDVIRQTYLNPDAAANINAP